MTININTPQVLTSTVSGGMDMPNISITALHDLRSDKYMVVSLLVEHPMIPVTPTLVRRLRLGTTRGSIIRQQLHEANRGLDKIPALKCYFSGANGRTVARKMRLDPDAAHLEITNAILRLARLVGDYPIRSVARCFALDSTEARAWVNAARKQAARD